MSLEVSVKTVIRTLLALVSFGPACLSILRADVITFVDSVDNGGSVQVYSTNPSRLTVTFRSFSGGIGELTVLVTAPSPGATVQPGPQFDFLLIGELNTGDPTTEFESDVLSGFGLNNGSVEQLFWYYADDTPFPCYAEGGCFTFEDGVLHTLRTITWSDGTKDIINFQSTPEPSAVALFATVLLLIGVTIRRRATTS
jgi:hypothetical protein